MTSICDAFGINSPVQFEELDINQDNRRFLDPRVIRINANSCPYASQASALIDSFFNEITRCVASQSRLDQAKGLRLLTKFEEPWETRLGLSSTGFQGRGASDVIGKAIWDALRGNLVPLIRIGVLKELEALPLFIENVGDDRTSDIATRIIYDTLCAFTVDMIAKYPQLASNGDGLQTVRRQFWDPHTLDWLIHDVTLPLWEGKPLVLVPRTWTRRNMLMTSSRFYDTSMLSYVQEGLASITPDGKVLSPPTKENLKRNSSYRRCYDTNIAITLQAAENGQNLCKRFGTFVNDRYAA